MPNQYNDHRGNPEPLPNPFKATESEWLGQLADSILESLEEEETSDWEPFEIYAQTLRSHIHMNSQAFRKQFIKGYDTLMQVLNQ